MNAETREAQALYLDALLSQLRAAEQVAALARFQYEEAMRNQS